MGNYNIGSDIPNAPWNQEELPEREVEVIISVTLSKTVTIKVSDYTINDYGKDEDGTPFEDIDYSNCDLKSAVEEQIVLPQNAWRHLLKSNGKVIDKTVSNLSHWNVDDMEVILEN